MENIINAKKHHFIVNIRKQQIQKFFKSKRKELITHQQHEQQHEHQHSPIHSSEQYQQYEGLLNYTNFDNLAKMDRNMISNHLQMLT